MRDLRSTSGKLAALALSVAVVSTVAPVTAEARPRPRRGARFEANKTFGLGLMLGVPSGLSGKYFVGRDQAFDFGVGVIGRYRNRDGLHLHFDYLWHPVVIAKTEPFELPLYFGLGARFFDWDDGDDDDFDIGLRVPVGIAFDFNNVPLDIFLEAAFVLDFETGGRGTYADVNGAAGIRYWFQ